MRNNNILKIIMIVLFAGAIVFGVYWLTNNSKKVVDSMNGTNIYTYEDVQKSYSDGYNTALENKSEYDELIASYRDTITTLTNNINTLNSQITTLQNTISTKNGNISELQAQITTLQTQKTNLESQITSLNNQIASLQSQIASLQSELENVYNYNYGLDITFMVDGDIYATGNARNGGTILVAPTEPTKSGYVFSGWSYTANGTVVDLSTEVITTNTTFYAIFELAPLSFTIDGTTYYAEDGMTWGEWVESAYNVDNEWTTYYWLDTDYVVLSNNYNTVISSVDSSNLILNNENYSTMGMAYCFVAGTKVLTSVNGNSENIENLNVGDEVVSLNVFTNEMYIAKIKFIKVTENVSNIVKVTLANGITIEMTEGHPLLCRDAFKTICDENENNKLKVGDEVYTINGYSEIVSIEYLTITTTVYNLNVIDFDEVDDNDTYDNFFANGICVHNIGDEPVPEVPPFEQPGYQYQELP